MRMPINGRMFGIVFVLLTILVIFFGVRAERTVSAVLSAVPSLTTSSN